MATLFHDRLTDGVVLEQDVLHGDRLDRQLPGIPVMKLNCLRS